MAMALEFIKNHWYTYRLLLNAEEEGMAMDSGQAWLVKMGHCGCGRKLREDGSCPVNLNGPGEDFW